MSLIRNLSEKGISIQYGMTCAQNYDQQSQQVEASNEGEATLEDKSKETIGTLKQYENLEVTLAHEIVKDSRSVHSLGLK